MPIVISAIIIALAAVGHVGWLRVARRSGEFLACETHVFAFTMQWAVWTALAFGLGFAGLLNAPAFVVALAVVTAIVVRFAFRKSQQSTAVSSPELRLFWREVGYGAHIAIVLGAGVSAYFLLLALRLPVIDYDGLSYHLGLAVHMAQDGDLRVYPGESGMTNYFARGGELIMAITILATKSIRFVKIVQWMVLPALALAIYAASRQRGHARGHAVLAAMLPLTTPVIAHQSAIPYADLLSAAWLCIGTLLGLAAFSPARRGPARLALVFVCGGLAVAAKFNVAVPVMIMGVATLIAFGWRGAIRELRARPTAIAAALALTLFVGLAWPIRNWIVAGSPVYPFELKIGNTVIAPGPFPLSVAASIAETPGFEKWSVAAKAWKSWTTLDWESWKRVGPFGIRMSELSAADLTDPNFGYRGDTAFGGHGLLWLVVLFPASLGALIGMFHGKPGELHRDVLFALLPWAYFFTTMAPWWPRFSIFMPVFGAVALAAALHHLPRKAAELIATAALLCAFIDAVSCTTMNRDHERLRRYREATHSVSLTPINYYRWVSSESDQYAAIAHLMHESSPDSTVCFFTPSDPVFTGFFSDAKAERRLFPFPSVWPPADSFTTKQYAQMLREESVDWILIGANASPEFLSMVNENGFVLSKQFGGYGVYSRVSS